MSEIRKLHIDYRMLRGKHESAESCIDLPISAERYAELAKGLTPDSAAWKGVQSALETLAFLQGYTLGAWSVDLEIEV
jgi:hypothetical protein